MRLLLLLLLCAPPRAAAAGGAVEIRPAGAETLAAVKSVALGPAGAGFSETMPGLGMIGSFEASSPSQMAALGVLCAFLPAGFDARVAAALEAGPAGQAALQQAALELQAAYVEGARAAALVLEAKAERLERRRRRLSAQEWREQADALDAFALFGGATAERLAGLRVAKAALLETPPTASPAAGSRLSLAWSAPEPERAAVPGRLTAPTLSNNFQEARRARGILIPPGTQVRVRLTSAPDERWKKGEPVSFTVVDDVRVKGLTMIKAGTLAQGIVTASLEASAFGRAGFLAVMPTSALSVDGAEVPLGKAGLRSDPPYGRNLLYAAIPASAGLVAAVGFLPAWVAGVAAALCLVLLMLPGYAAKLRQGRVVTSQVTAPVLVRRLGRGPGAQAL